MIWKVNWRSEKDMKKKWKKKGEKESKEALLIGSYSSDSPERELIGSYAPKRLGKGSTMGKG